VDQAGRYAKLLLAPVALADARGFRSNELGEIRRLVERHRAFSRRSGVSTSANRHQGVKPESLAVDVRCTADALIVRLADGREVSVPLEWFPRLRDATPEQRMRWRLIGGGIGINWEEVDEDISVESLLATH
jgi:hypothetical protein